MPRKIWITGASGYLGHQLVSHLSSSPDFDVLPIGGVSRRLSVSGDLNDTTFISSLVSTYGMPEVVIHCAGNKDVPLLREHPELARKANCEATATLFRAMAATTHFIYISSDHVFSGKAGEYDERSRPDPATVYGYSKYLSERYLCRFQNVTIVRTAAVFDKNAAFPKMLLDKWLAGDVVSCFDDMFYSPVYLPCFINGIEQVVRKRVLGMLHLCGPRTSRYQFAKTLAEQSGVPLALVKAESRYAEGERQDLSLRSTSSWSRIEISCPTLEEAIAQMLVKV